MTRIKVKYFVVYKSGSSDKFAKDLQDGVDNWLEENKNFHIVDVKVCPLSKYDAVNTITYYESVKRNLMIEKEYKNS